MKAGWYRFAVGFLCVAAAVMAGSPQYKFSPAGDYPGAFLTMPLTVKGGYIGGYYEPIPAPSVGYVQHGTTFQNLLPFASKSSYVGGINRLGEAVGGYCPSGCSTEAGQHGFIYSHGTYTQIDYPSGQQGTTTTAFGINDPGQIVGGYCLPPLAACPEDPEFAPANHGFLDDHGKFTQLDYPGAQYTEANAINNAGMIVGNYFVNNSAPHAFLYQNGIYTNIDLPNENFTYVSAINNLGVAAGNYQDRNSFVHGFFYRNGKFTTIDVPGATVTNLNANDDTGVIVGIWSNAKHDGNFKGIPVR